MEQEIKLDITLSEENNMVVNEFFHLIGELMGIQMFSEKHHKFVMDTMDSFKDAEYIYIKPNEDKTGGAIIIKFDTVINKIDEVKTKLEEIKKEFETLMTFDPLTNTIQKNGIILPSQDIMNPSSIMPPISNQAAAHSGIIIP